MPLSQPVAISLPTLGMYSYHKRGTNKSIQAKDHSRQTICSKWL